jgi:hypothetical protein
MSFTIGDGPPPVADGDEAIILKVLYDEDGEPDLMMWTAVPSPDHALVMLSAAIQVVVTNLTRVDDHE